MSDTRVGTKCNGCERIRTSENCLMIPRPSGNGFYFYHFCRACVRAKCRLQHRKQPPKKTCTRRDKHKEAARYRLRTELKSGRMERQPCEVCGKKAEAHHPDYSKPLEVRWLCRKHHAMEHWMPTDSPLMEKVMADRKIHERNLAETGG